MFRHLEMDHSIGRFVNGLRIAAGGPWCGQCGRGFTGQPRVHLRNHWYFKHQMPAARAFCMSFGIKWYMDARSVRALFAEIESLKAQLALAKRENPLTRAEIEIVLQGMTRRSLYDAGKEKP